MTSVVILTLFLAAVAEPGGQVQDPRQEILDFALKRNQPWQKAYSAAALATLDAGEQLVVEKLKGVGFRVEARGMPAYRFIWKDGQKSVEAPRGIDLCYGLPPSAKPSEKRGSMENLAALAQLRHVEKLDLRGADLTDDMLDWLKGMSDLWYLRLSTTRISDAGLKKLGHMKRLNLLQLDAVAGLTDAAGPALAALPALAELDLRGTRIGDAGVSALAKSVSLKKLSLGDTKVGDAGVIALAALPSLRNLGLDGTRITEKALAAMSRPGCFGSLEILNVSRNAVVTDDALKVLLDPQALPKLRLLCLPDDKVSEEFLATLQTARPELRAYPIYP